ncbi:hypothetical protein COI_0190 [Mannheimia haemolytica serotype A2 str. OVINE]|nr:hypothetical protein B824_25280 [Mannheimia haemolytica USDA-ARS-USMARC-184]EEY11165.1 hypothetical protein COI_0190 [Mannheimia haemolytica serotype A2 str. OVINE]EEY11545.1 hypothetical protein COK_2379 [Mannheimia haemolytica serotype A2 str. BOVINE]TRC23473.1 hypothetical protein FEA24_00375 [Mannheimia haemolytica]TRC26099.1 hypothetical protein FEA55_00320 [Mannheimia haemolytica]
MPFEPSLPLIPIVPSLPGPPIVKSLFNAKVTLLSVVSLVMMILPSSLLNETLPLGPTLVLLLPFAAISQPEFATS